MELLCLIVEVRSAEGGLLLLGLVNPRFTTRTTLEIQEPVRVKPGRAPLLFTADADCLRGNGQLVIAA